MEIRSHERSAPDPKNRHSPPLIPRPALNAPFEAAWCVVHPNSSSIRHAHPDYEIFSALSGEAIVKSRGGRQSFRRGDIVHFPPNTDHQVFNEGAEDFRMYAVWRTGETVEGFPARHRGEV
ncbi:cupin domain-containing protein [Embleya sp. AB8]|uniref:cupin domain-containing protein n=1 Tax=Embleya sp. AB8 TaxID=3156304 RepID=UPI003C770FE6